MDLLLIFDTFRTLSGLERDEAIKWLSLCTSAAQGIGDRRREDCDPDENRVILASAAAASAFYNYVLIICALDGDSSFKAGDVTVKESTKEKISAAKSLRDEAMEQIGHLLADRSFDFRTVVC